MDTIASLYAATRSPGADAMFKVEQLINGCAARFQIGGAGRTKRFTS